MSLVESKAGKFEGLSQNECYQFFGIPYAKYNQRWGKSTLLKKKYILKLYQKEIRLLKHDLMIKASQEQVFPGQFIVKTI